MDCHQQLNSLLTQPSELGSQLSSCCKYQREHGDAHCYSLAFPPQEQHNPLCSTVEAQGPP